jgi:diacylglycerol kinase family enzyme
MRIGLSSRMRVTLIHQPSAGDDDHAADALRSLVADAGHEVSYTSMKQPGWGEALEDASDLVVVAGGDGSVGKVFREVATKGTSVTLLPVGSANNIARSLGIPDVEVERLVRGWAEGEHRRLDLGEATAPWGRTLFVESLGGGIFGEVLARAAGVENAVEVDGDEKIELGLEILRDVIEDIPAREWRVEVDDDDLSGELLAVEAMNIGQMGPNLPLAEQADPGDGLLDVVLIRDEDRSNLVAYLSVRMRELDPALPGLRRARGERVVLEPPRDLRLHADDRLWPPESDTRADGTVVVTCGPSLTVLVPRCYRTGAS